MIPALPALVVALLGSLAAMRALGRRRRRAAFALGVAAALGAAGLVLELHHRVRGERPFPGPRAAVPAGGFVASPPPPPPPGRPLQFIAWGDARGGASVFERVRAEIRARRPDFSIGLGDLVGMARPYQYEVLTAQLQATGVPFLLVPGNHDLDPFGSLAPYESVCGPSDWRFESGDVSFFGVDSAAGPVSAEGLARFLEGSRDASARGRRIVVFTHHPPFPPTGREDKTMPASDPNVVAFRSELERVHATTFCGDFHAYDRRVVGNVTQVVTGGAGSSLESEDLHHVLLVTVTPTSIEAERIEFPPRHETPTFDDRWITFRDEALHLASRESARVLAIALLAGASIGAGVGALRRRRVAG